MINTSYYQPIQRNNSGMSFANAGGLNFQNSVVSNYDRNIYGYNTKSLYKDPEVTHTSWFYINDLHGKMTKMERIYGMMQDFESTSMSSRWNFFKGVQDKDISKFKVESGDIFIGANSNNNKVASQFLKWMKFDAMTPGNHEFDVPNPANLAQLLQDTQTPVLAANMIVKKGSPLEGKFVPSKIIKKDGIDVGFIGICPSDIKDRVKYNDSLGDIEVQSVDETIKTVQKEVEKLQQQGIKHIVLLSHSGLHNDKRIATETQGIDIIFSAHTHELIKDIKDGENLLYSKSGEPVVLTQAGKNGEHIGVLNIDFDKNGVIKKAQNNVISTDAYSRPLYVKDSVEKIIGKPEVVGKVNKAVPLPKNILIEDNPHGNIIVDAMRSELGTEIALLNAGNIRGAFTSGSTVDSRLVSDITPFEDKMMILNLSEKQIVEAIKFGCKSIPTNTKPGILFVSGMRYKCNKKGELLSLEFIDKNNHSHKIDINNPREDKKYTVAADDFFAMGGDNYLPNNPNPDFVLKTFDVDKNKLACDYIKKLNQPFDVDYDGRIEIVD